MKVFVFGANGMLGTYMSKCLKGSIGITRDQVDAMVVQNKKFYSQLESLEITHGDVIINATGIINKRVREPLEFFTVNSLFPRLLADYCEKVSIGMIHVTTDCVFDGKKGNYTEDDTPDDVSVYSVSKSAGEPLNCTVIRASIIGENRNNSQDLLEWVRTQRSTTVTGWTNHIWNGITCLQLAKICEWIINNNQFWAGTRHVFSPKEISKADLVEMISSVYELNNIINKIPGPFDCNRTLSSIYHNPYVVPELLDQIIDQKNFEL